jgi:hypothetical protein
MATASEEKFMNSVSKRLKEEGTPMRRSKTVPIFTDGELEEIKNSITNIMENSTIKIKKLDRSVLEVRQDSYYEQINRFTVLSSNIVDDIHAIDNLKEKLESVLSKMELKILLFARCKSNIKFKNVKETDSYLRSQREYSVYKELYEETKSKKTKYENYFTIIKETKGLLRDLIKFETQKRFSGKWES